MPREFFVTIELVDPETRQIVGRVKGRIPSTGGYVQEMNKWFIEQCVILKMMDLFGGINDGSDSKN